MTPRERAQRRQRELHGAPPGVASIMTLEERMAANGGDIDHARAIRDVVAELVRAGVLVDAGRETNRLLAAADALERLQGDEARRRAWARDTLRGGNDPMVPEPRMPCSDIDI